MKKTTEDHSEDVRGMVKKTTEDLWEEAADSFNRLETFRNLAIQNERECAEPFGYWFKQERRFADLEEAERYFDVGETRELLKPLFTFPPAPQASGDTEPIYAFRRKGLTDFCTCDREIFIEFSQKPKLFDVKMFFTFPPPPQPYQVPEGYALIGIPVLKAWGKYEEVNEACRFPVEPQTCPSKKDAIEALDNMDDYARMDIGVDAIGPRKVLEDYINQHCPGCESSIAIMEMHCAKVRSQAARIKELEADAARYRWLRDNKAQNNTHCWHFQNGPIIPGLLTLDTAIDAALETASILDSSFPHNT